MACRDTDVIDHVMLSLRVVRTRAVQDRNSGSPVRGLVKVTFSSAWMRQVLSPGEHGQDERVDSVRACGMGRARAQAAPEMHDRRAVAYRGCVDQFVFQRGIAIDRFVDRPVEADDPSRPRT